MSILRKPLVLACLAASVALSGCKESKPSDKTIQEFLYQTVNSYDLYNRSFTIASWKKLNGWKDNENYVVSAEVALQSKVSYLDLISSCAIESEPYLNGSWAEKSNVTLAAMQANLTGTGPEFIKFWNDTASQEVWSPELQALSKRLKQDDWTMLLTACDYALLAAHGSIIGRNLKQGEEIVRTYQLNFKNTEKGWLGFSG